MQFNRCLGCMEEIQGYPCPHCGFDPRVTPASSYVLPLGAVLNGHYVVGKMLGQGGFGITYIGYDLNLERKVAIKEFYPKGHASRYTSTTTLLQWPEDPQSQSFRKAGMEAFLREAQKMVKVEDIPEVVRIRECFHENGTAYIVMDYIEGKTLLAALKEKGPMAWEQAKDVFYPAITAMEKVHQAGLVHRDLSPDNLMLTDKGVRILDLGAAKDLSTGSGVSSAQVAKSGFSPFEQYTQSGGSGPWSDVYAMAATIYYTLTGVLPPNATDRMEEDTLDWTLLTKRGVPTNVIRALQKAMHITAKGRTQTMGELLKGLQGGGAPQEEKKVQGRQAADSKVQVSQQKVHSWKKPDLKALWKKDKRPILIAAIAAVCVLVAAIVLLGSSTPKLGEAISMERWPEGITESQKYGILAQRSIAASGTHTVAIRKDGTVVAQGNNEDGECKVDKWTDIVAVDANDGITVGLRKDGVVLTAGSSKNGKRNVGSWRNIVAIAAGEDHTVGLKADGTVVAKGSNKEGQCDVKNWTNIVAIAADSSFTLGLKKDGTVLVAGDIIGGMTDIRNWTEVAAIRAGSWGAAGLRRDGTVVVAGFSSYDKDTVGTWKNIVSIDIGARHVLGLKIDGTVVTAGGNDEGQCDISWDGVAAVAAGNAHSLGLLPDGTLLAQGSNNYKQCDVGSWKGLLVPTKWDAVLEEEKAKAGLWPEGITEEMKYAALARRSMAGGGFHNVAIRKDGTVLAAGNNDDGQCDVGSWKNIVAVSAGVYHTVGLREDGRVVATGKNHYGQCDVDNWTDIVAVTAGGYHTLGLRSDGTVVAVGSNNKGACEVEEWTDIVALAAGNYFTVGLKRDGTVVVAGGEEEYTDQIRRWTGIVGIYVHPQEMKNCVGLKRDGTVVAVGTSEYGELNGIEDWKDIVSVSCAYTSVTGVKRDGTVVTTSPNFTNMATWSDVIAVACGKYYMGLRSDGTVYEVFNKKDVTGWENLLVPEK